MSESINDNFNLDEYILNLSEKRKFFLSEIKNFELDLEQKKIQFNKIDGALEFANSVKESKITNIHYNNENKNIPLLGSLIPSKEK